MSSRKLILFDVDETLVTPACAYYKDRTLQAALRGEMDRGAIIGICTARDEAGSLPIYQALQLNGPLILEKGGRIFLPSQDQDMLHELLPDMLRQEAKESITTVRSAVRKWGKAQGITVSNKPASEVDIPQGRVVVLSHQRQTTLTLAAYQDGELSWAMREHLQAWFEPFTTTQFPGLCVERNLITPKLHIGARHITKMATALMVQAAHYPDRRVFLIGDDEATEISPAAELILMGVHSSTDVYRDVCHYVAHLSGVGGLTEVLQQTERI